MNTRLTGFIGEEDACRYLTKAGMRILDRNYRTRTGEIDLIARDKGVIVFIEVKSRATLSYGTPSEAVTKSKQKAIVRTAVVYLKENKLLNANIRFDVIAIEDRGIRHIKSAFDTTGLL